MIKKFNIKFKVKNEILALTILIILTSIFTIGKDGDFLKNYMIFDMIPMKQLIWLIVVKLE